MLYRLDTSPTILADKSNACEFIVKMAGQKYHLYGTFTTIPITQEDEYKDNNPKRNFIVIDFDESNLKNVIHDMKTIMNNPTHLIYKTKSKCRLIVDLKQNFNYKSYKKVVKAFYIQLNLPITKSRLDLKKPIAFIPFDVNKDILQAVKSKPYSVVLDSIDESNDNLAPDATKLFNATKEFLDTSEANRIMHDRLEVTKFFDALAKCYISGQLTKDYLDKTLQYITQKTGYDLSNWQTLMQERITLLKDHPDMRESAQPFGAYIHLYTQAYSGANLTQQLKAVLPKNIKEDPDYDLSEAADFIEMAYPPYLIDRPGNDIDNLVIYDSSHGMWTHNPDILYSLLTAIKPYTSKAQFETFMMTFAAKARNAERFFRPYHGSRYILFNNGVLDVATLTLIPISDPKVRDLHFTERSHIDLDYVDNPALPQIPNERTSDNGPWNPRDFLMAYANNDHDAYTYLLFGLSLGLFAGHNFGVHFDIKGGSRWGKSTLIAIYNKLYQERTVTIPFPNLNTQFPFTSYPLDTAIIWLDEANEGIDPLDDEHGTITYDSLADNQARFQVKNKGDMVIEDPPQVYITGTQFIKARELYTGPAGRTLAMKLPLMTDKLRAQSYAKSIYEDLRKKTVLQWLVYNFIIAYKEIVPVERMDNLKINLANKSDLALFPPIALSWRKEFVVGGNSIDSWFENAIEPYLSHDPSKPTYLHERILYEIFLDSYRLANPNDTYARNAPTSLQIIKRLKTIWNSEEDKFVVNYSVGSVEKGRKTPRKMIKDPDKMNFDWQSFDQDYSRPAKLEEPGYQNLKLFGKKSPDWIEIYMK